MKLLSFLSRGLAIFFAAAFVVVLLLLQFVVNADNYLMQPQRYKTALEERRVYEKIPGLLAAELNKLSTQMQPDQVENRQTEAFAKVLQSMDEDDWRFMVETLMPEDWAQSQVEAVVDSFFAYLDGETETVNMTVSLEVLKSRLGEPQGQEVLLRLVEALPECTGSDLFNFAFDLFTTGDPDLPICVPPINLIEDNVDSLSFLLTMAADAIPSSLTFQLTEEDFESISPESEGVGSNLVTTYRWTKRIRGILPLVAGGLLLLIALFAVRSFHGLLNWWGWPLTLGSAAALVTALTFNSQIIALIERYVAARISNRLSADIAEIPLGITRELSIEMLATIKFQTGLLLLAGLGMVVIGFLLSQRARAAREQAEWGPPPENLAQ